MKRTLLSMAVAALAALPAVAQWATDPSENNLVSPVGQSNYGYDIKTTDEGLSYLYMHIPNSSNPSLRIQIIDKDGYLKLTDEGKELSAEENLTYTKVNQNLMIDNEGNAIVAVSDFRTGGEGFTIYKVNDKGDVLWSKTLNNDVSLDFVAKMCMACSEDGGYVFAYMAYSDDYGDGGVSFVCVEKLTADGNAAWEEPLLFKDETGKTEYSFPYIVDAGSSQTMLIYAKGASEDLYAHLIDFDGSSVWGEDVVVWQGGFTSNPLHTMMDVTKAPGGGAFVAWMDPDDSAGNYENRLSYVMNDGTYGFATGELGTNVSNANEYSRGYPVVYCDEKEKAIYCVYQQFDQAWQSLHGIYMQKISFDGELLWGADGKAVIPMQSENTYSYYSIQGAGDGKIAVFYMKLNGSASNSSVGSYMVLYDKDGNEVQAPVNFTTSEANKTGLQTSQLINGEYYLANWEETTSGYEKQIYMQRVFLDGSFTGIKNVTGDNAPKTLLRQEIYSANGERLQTLSTGVNIVRNVYSDNTTETVKRIVK